jgi:hypothetical protein
MWDVAAWRVMEGETVWEPDRPGGLGKVCGCVVIEAARSASVKPVGSGGAQVGL